MGSTPPVVVVAAAGAGQRLGLGLAKAFAPWRGATLIETCLARIRGISSPVHVIVVGPADSLARMRELATRSLEGSLHTVDVVAGGSSRQASVQHGLHALPPGTEIVLVHDAARADTPPEVFEAVIAAVSAQQCGVIPALPVVDSLKHVVSGRLQSVDRAEYLAAQTPQGFPAEALVSAYRQATREFTDDAGLFEAAGGRVISVPGDALAKKITFLSDLTPAEAHVRTGIGVDMHRLDMDAPGPLRLAGMDWPGEHPLLGHSDGDVVLHAICDALLSAAECGDMGTRFGTSRPEFAGADSAVFVRETLRILQHAGYAPVQVAVQLVGERPRIGQRRSEVEQHVSACVGVPVSFGATSTDQLGFLGVDEGIAAVATALVRRVPDGERVL